MSEEFLEVATGTKYVETAFCLELFLTQIHGRSRQVTPPLADGLGDGQEERFSKHFFKNKLPSSVTKTSMEK